MTKLRCGIVGCGYMGEIRKRVIEAIPELELTGVVEPNHKKWEQINSCDVFDSFDELIEIEDFPSEKLDIIKLYLQL